MSDMNKKALEAALQAWFGEENWRAFVRLNTHYPGDIDAAQDDANRAIKAYLAARPDLKRERDAMRDVVEAARVLMWHDRADDNRRKLLPCLELQELTDALTAYDKERGDG